MWLLIPVINSVSVTSIVVLKVVLTTVESLNDVSKLQSFWP